MKTWIASVSTALCALSAQAAGLESLENFVRSAHSGSADFTQVVTAPAREGQQARSKTSSGTFEFQRPNRFRFHYQKPFEQVIVADGQTLWLHDLDLNQVTARSQSQVLGATPAALVAAAPDLAALRKDFELQEAPQRDGLQWVQATPRARDGQLRSVLVGFRGKELAALEILDSFGQRSVMTFTGMQPNVPLPAGTFQFKPPAGADVLRQ
ncbi:outer membrane lipoprotein chaperone LolA [Ramlibacter tataouinensis]|uniref:Outer-membrane lipoprotein carrier protein n=1 Tax=Ramlibacter tataouinensis (strain ATCC BAA-407 / DSM 14655 / LMG 21543 / TTB310) TaxID=365046 RepID=F5XXE0_RAMTT|nr:outer membrane lipoprotein chaperone LolA [Ramlibacter tataouinensis]AEG94275.1 Candidate Outer-membrane lipoproteins carrier protein precursor [Ramlibacter tataouinensis TTB310]